MFSNSVYGIFDNREPVLLLRDPELIKRIMIRDFDHFVNRRQFLPDDRQNLLANSLFMMQNNKWRDMRSTLSPAFTGSKMRQMFQLMLQTIEIAMCHLRDQQEAAGATGFMELEAKDFSSRLTNDIIASTAFGLEVNSFRDKDNEFYVQGKKAMNFTRLQQLKGVFIMLMPKIAGVSSEYIKFPANSKHVLNTEPPLMSTFT